MVFFFIRIIKGFIVGMGFGLDEVLSVNFWVVFSELFLRILRMDRFLAFIVS